MSTWAIADIHGQFDHLERLLALITENGFSLGHDTLVVLGDMNDRGPDTFKVIEHLRLLQQEYPLHVVVLMGNHERMLLETAAGDSDLLYYNGGNKTLDSYSRQTKLYGKRSLLNSLGVTGHFEFLKGLPLYYETPEYFFCHAPIARRWQEQVRIPGINFRQVEGLLTWGSPSGYGPEAEKAYVHPDPAEGKLCVFGHIHGMQVKTIPHTGEEYVFVPGVRRYDNSILLDTGCGCAEAGYLSAIQLPERRIFNSKGETYILN